VNSYLELAQHPLIDARVNDVVGTPQDVCDNSIFDKVLKPVNDSNVQIQENEMSCEPMQVSNDLWLLSQQPFQNACKIGGKDVPNNVMPQSLPCREQSATNNLPIELLNKPLEFLSQPLSSTTSCQDELEQPEVLFLSVHSEMETEQNIEESRIDRDCQQKQGQAKSNCKRHIDLTENNNIDDSSKRIQEDDNDDNLATTESNETNEKTCPIAKMSFKNILTMSVFLDQKLKHWVAIVCQKMLLSHDQIFNLCGSFLG